MRGLGPSNVLYNQRKGTPSVLWSGCSLVDAWNSDSDPQMDSSHDIHSRKFLIHLTYIFGPWKSSNAARPPCVAICPAGVPSLDRRPIARPLCLCASARRPSGRLVARHAAQPPCV